MPSITAGRPFNTTSLEGGCFCNGKNGMPAFGANLGTDDIADVTAYVESQSINDWA